MSSFDEIYIPEYPTPFSIDETEIIINQMKKCICKIYINNIQATGFFCKIPYLKKDLTVLITCYHLFENLNLENNQEIKFYIFNRKQPYSINLDNKRNFHFSEKYDTTIIELNSEEIKDFEFLELDENIINNKISRNELIGETLYAIHYPKGENAFVSYGILSNNKKKHEYQFAHLCSTKEGSSGSPILLKKSGKIIGIHKGFSNNGGKVYNNAYFLNYPINEFKSKLKEININKKILILRNKLNRLEKLQQNVISNDEMVDNSPKTKNKNNLGYKKSGKKKLKKILVTKIKKRKSKSQSPINKNIINNDNKNNCNVENGMESNNYNKKQKLPPINCNNICRNMNEKKNLNKNISMIIIYKNNNE